MSKAKFREVCPGATIERRRTTGYKTYYLVRKRRGEFMYTGCGDTAGAAWRDAWAKLLPTLQAAACPPKDEA